MELIYIINKHKATLYYKSGFFKNFYYTEINYYIENNICEADF